MPARRARCETRGPAEAAAPPRETTVSRRETKPAAPIRLLAVEDDPSLSFVLEEALGHTREAEIDATMASSLAEAFELVDAKRFELVLLDLSLPDSDGLETLTRMRRKLGRKVPIVVLTGNDDPELARRIAEEGVDHYLLKGEVGSKVLVSTIRAASQRGGGVAAPDDGAAETDAASGHQRGNAA